MGVKRGSLFFLLKNIQAGEQKGGGSLFFVLTNIQGGGQKRGVFVFTVDK